MKIFPRARCYENKRNLTRGRPPSMEFFNEIIKQIDPAATGITFRRERTGACLYQVIITPNKGPCFVLPDSFNDIDQANLCIKHINFAYRLSIKTHARQVVDKVKSKT